MNIERSGIRPGTGDRGLRLLRQEQARLQTQLATGLRVQAPSDDPAAFARARTLGGLESQLAQYARNIDGARLWTDTTQVALGNLTEQLMQASETGMRALNAARSPEDRELMARHLETVFARVVETVNTRTGDRYLFGGDRNQAPVDAAGALTGNVGGAHRVRIGTDVEVEVGLPGEEVIGRGESSLFARLKGLTDAVRAGETAGIQEALAGIKTVQERMALVTGAYGDVSRSVDTAQTVVDDLSVLYAERRSDTEDSDLVETTSRLSQMQFALEAALRVAASARQTSLLNYLR